MSLSKLIRFRGQYLIENHPTKPAQIQHHESLVLTLQEGSFFGEIALLSGKPRQATVKASGVVSVLVIGRDAFDRLCGSLIDILQRNMSNYSNMELPETAPDVEKGVNGIPSMHLISQLTSVRRHSCLDPCTGTPRHG